MRLTGTLSQIVFALLVLSVVLAGFLRAEPGLPSVAQLAATRWTAPSNGVGGFVSLVLRPDGFALVEWLFYEAPTGQFKGRWKVSGRSLHFSDFKNVGKENVAPLEDFACAYRTVAGHTRFLFMLDCGQRSPVYDDTHIRAIGSAMTISGAEAIVLGSKELRTTAATVIRSHPSTGSRTIAWCDPVTEANKPRIPAGTVIVAGARTRAKTTVGRMNDAWYYIEFTDVERDGPAPAWVRKYGWVFGGFLKPL